jgi:class 3 adenylate cyclase
VRSALAIQEALDALAARRGIELRASVGVHRGDAVLQRRDVRGTAVADATRLAAAAAAAGGGVLVSATVRDAAIDDVSLRFDGGAAVPVPGSGEIEVYEALRAETATACR